MKTLRYWLACLLAAPLSGGPFAGPAGTPGSLAVPYDDPGIAAWATGYVALTRGPAQAGDASAGFATFGYGELALGPAGEDVYDVVSLGDGGSITLTFDAPITNGPGWDFAVFENSFGDTFLELAFVEVSSDGVNFFRFPAVSLTATGTQVGTYGHVDATELRNLAGKYRLGNGTPFDLSELAGVDERLDVAAVTHVRVVDAVGAIGAGLGSVDSLGNRVNDPWPTPFAAGGFDLDAIGVRHAAVSPASGYAAWAAGFFAVGEAAGEAAADPDGDGCPNLLEYALGGDPRSPADGAVIAPRLVRSEGGLGLAYRPAANRPDLSWGVEWSADLAVWDGTETALWPAETSADGEVTTWARRTLTETPRQFLRLRVERVAP